MYREPDILRCFNELRHLERRGDQWQPECFRRGMNTTEFVDFKCLAPGALIDVETRNRHYQIECLGGTAIRISGHPDYCPDPVSAQLQGSSKQGVLEPTLLGCGMHLRFVLPDLRPVMTSRVLTLHVDQPIAPGPVVSTSIH